MGQVDEAYQVYERGAHSQSIATVTLSTPLPINVARGSDVSGMGLQGQEIIGTTHVDAPVGSTTLSILYTVHPDISDYCRVGGNPIPEFDGCTYAICVYVRLSLSLSLSLCDMCVCIVVGIPVFRFGKRTHFVERMDELVFCTDRILTYPCFGSLGISNMA